MQHRRQLLRGVRAGMGACIPGMPECLSSPKQRTWTAFRVNSEPFSAKLMPTTLTSGGSTAVIVATTLQGSIARSFRQTGLCSYLSPEIV
jgi:hypothetical protein